MNKKNLLYLLPALLIIWGDQALKTYIRTTLPLYATQTLWPGVVELTYVQNTGAAFSLFSAHTWILTVISALAALLIVVLLVRGYFKHPLGQLALALVLAGAVGNLIDRALLGYVVDMFSLQFMHFAIFNIADIGVVLGGVLLFVYLLFFWRGGEKPTAEVETVEAMNPVEEPTPLLNRTDGTTPEEPATPIEPSKEEPAPKGDPS